MSRTARRAQLPPPTNTMEKLKNMVDEGKFYEAQQMYKSTIARYVTAQRYSDALDILEAGALAQLSQGQVTCGAELAVIFVDTLVKGALSYDSQTLDRLRKIYEAFPKLSSPQLIGVDDDDDEVQKLSEAIAAAKVRAETCAKFLRAAIKWSAESGGPKNGSPELHEMLAEYLYSESPETDMAKVSSHFVRGNNPKNFVSTLTNFMTKCYPGEDDIAIARAVLMYLSQGNLRDANFIIDELKEQLKSSEVEFPESDLIQFIEYLLLTLQRDALPLFRTLRLKYKSSIDRDPLFDELLDEIAEKFYGVRKRNPLQGMFGDLFKMF